MEDITTLYQGIQKTIYDVCHNYIGSATKHYMDFDDLVSLCHIYFMKNYNKYDKTKGASFNTFMKNIFSKSLSKHFRDLEADKRHFKGKTVRIDAKTNENAAESTDFSEILPDKKDFLLDIEYKELLQEVLKVANLTKNGRTIVLLRERGYKIAEIANIIGVKERDVTNSLYRFRKNLIKNQTIENYYSIL